MYYTELPISTCAEKVCNNLSLAVSMVGVAEAMSLGSKMGMDPKVSAAVASLLPQNPSHQIIHVSG